jgi:hypothetical protein
VRFLAVMRLEGMGAEYLSVTTGTRPVSLRGLHVL